MKTVWKENNNIYLLLFTNMLSVYGVWSLILWVNCHENWILLLFRRDTVLIKWAHIRRSSTFQLCNVFNNFVPVPVHSENSVPFLFFPHFKSADNIKFPYRTSLRICKYLLFSAFPFHKSNFPFISLHLAKWTWERWFCTRLG